MKPRIFHVLILIVLMPLGLPAAIVTGDGVLLNSQYGPPGGQYSLTVAQNNNGPIPQSDYTGMSFNITSAGLQGFTLTPATYYADEGADFYVVQPGAQFSASTIAAGDFTPVLVLDQPSSVTIHRGIFYLGINTGEGYLDPNGTVPRRDVFGWVELDYNGQTLTMLGNAMGFDTGGITIGAVPEAKQWWISGILALGLACFSGKPKAAGLRLKAMLS